MADNGFERPLSERICYRIAKRALERAELLAAGEATWTNEEKLESKDSVFTSLVFSALCLEAFINFEGQRVLNKVGRSSKTQWGKFTELPVTERWNRILDLLGTSTFDEDAEPFARYATLVKKIRNERLVHCTPRKETFDGDGEKYAEFLTEVLSDVPRARMYFDLIKTMVDELHTLSGQVTSPFDFDQGGTTEIETPILGHSSASLAATELPGESGLEDPNSET